MALEATELRVLWRALAGALRVLYGYLCGVYEPF